MTKKEISKIMRDEIELLIRLGHDHCQEWRRSDLKDQTALKCMNDDILRAFQTVMLMTYLGVINEQEATVLRADIIERITA